MRISGTDPHQWSLAKKYFQKFQMLNQKGWCNNPTKLQWFKWIDILYILFDKSRHHEKAWAIPTKNHKSRQDMTLSVIKVKT